MAESAAALGIAQPPCLPKRPNSGSYGGYANSHACSHKGHAPGLSLPFVYCKNKEQKGGAAGGGGVLRRIVKNR